MNTEDMKGWTTLSVPSGDWTQDAMYGRKVDAQHWYVVRVMDLWDATGEEYGERFNAEVKLLDFTELPRDEIAQAMRSCGWSWTLANDAVELTVIDTHSGSIVATGSAAEACIVECCAQYGLGAPLEQFCGKRSINVRAEARRFAEQCMKDAALVERQLDRPVNAIGSTARDFGRGDITAGLHRSPFGAEKNLVRKMHGMEPGPAGLLAGAVIHTIKQSDMRRCPFSIMVMEHYRADGSCKCDDAEHRKLMVREWGYKAKNFAGIPLAE
jgi:hypothetical protein